MNDRRTHNNITNAFFPYLNNKLVNNVNHTIDNVPIWARSLSTFQKRDNKVKGFIQNPYDIFNLTKQGHRKYGHDMMSAMLLGGMQARKMGLPHTQGMLAAYSHLATDNFSNHLIKVMGTPGRNMWEALYSYNQDKMQKRMGKNQSRR